MPLPHNDVFTSEFCRLQRRVKVLSLLCSAMAVVGGILLLTGFASTPVQDVVTAKSFVLVDDSGDVLATLGRNGNNTQFRLTSKDQNSQVLMTVLPSASTSPLGGASVAIATDGPSGVCGGPETGMKCGGINMSSSSSNGGVSSIYLDSSHPGPNRLRFMHLWVNQNDGSTLQLCGAANLSLCNPVFNQK
jgi:hypothetical protein